VDNSENGGSPAVTLKWVFNLASLNNEVIQQQPREEPDAKKNQKIPISDAIRAR
jgi:hypothetical protein